jgi:RND family efflux transporter MFP subunit
LISILAIVVIAGAAGAYVMRDQLPSSAPAAATDTAAQPVTPVVDPAPSGGAAALTVSLVAPTPVNWNENIVASGSISAWQEAVVSAEVSGLRISEVAVDVGDEVKKGDVLVRFDAATMQAAVAQQRAMVDEARARLEEAATLAKRAQQLRQSAAISEQDLIQSVSRAQAADAALQSARARLQASELNLRFTTVTAPDDGVISARNAMLGAVTGPGAELFRLVRQNRLEWRAELTGAQLLRITPGQSAELTLPDGSKAVGTVRQVAPVLDAKSRTGIVYVELDRVASPAARAGMFASGTLVSGERAGFALPASAVVLRDGHEMVFRLSADNRVEGRKVETGRRQGSLVEVVSGIDSTERVVGSGAAFLNTGDPVRVVDAPVPGTSDLAFKP